MHSIDPVDQGLGTPQPNNLVRTLVLEASGEPLNRVSITNYELAMTNYADFMNAQTSVIRAQPNGVFLYVLDKQQVKAN